MTVARIPNSRQMRSPNSIYSSIGGLAVPGLTKSMFMSVRVYENIRAWCR